MSTRLLLAKRRSARRAESAGAVMFIVAMTMAVLAALGMFALRAASYEERTSGYERQNAQTHYLSEYGVLAASTEINATSAQAYLGFLQATTGVRDTNCVSLAPKFTISGTVSSPSSSSLACRREGSAELSKGWSNTTLTPSGNTQNVTVLDPWKATTTPGSLGNAPIDGDFFIEITDPIPMGLQANNASNLGRCFFEVTVTSVGITRPSVLAIPQGQSYTDTALFGSEGLESQRARFIIGPVTSSICRSN
jgi:Tfp pilus assembly protein PilX